MIFLDRTSRNPQALSTYPNLVQEAIQDVWHGDGEGGAARCHDAVDDAHPALEVVAEDGQRRRVGKCGAGAEEDAVRKVQGVQLQEA